MRIKPVRERNPVAVALVGLFVLALVAVAAYRADALPYIGGGTTYDADFTESAGLGDGDEVRIAGVKVGEVTGVALDGDKVKVSFKVESAWIGDASTVGIAIKTLLGEKYLAVDPLGNARQDPHERIPASRTTSPYDVTQAFNGLGETIGAIDTRQLAKSFETISATFKDSPPDVKSAADGLSALSRTVSERDAQLATLLKGSKQLTKTLAGKKSSSPRPSPARRAASRRCCRTAICSSARSRRAATPSICCSPAPVTSAPSSPGWSPTTTSS